MRTVSEQPHIWGATHWSAPSWSPHCARGCCCWRGEEPNGRRGYGCWRRVRKQLCCWKSLNCWRVPVRRTHLWRGSWESCSPFGDRDCFGHSWITNMLAFKLLSNFLLFLRVSHWLVVLSVNLIFMCAHINRSWFRHRVVFWCTITVVCFGVEPDNLSERHFVAVLVSSLIPDLSLKLELQFLERISWSSPLVDVAEN